MHKQYLKMHDETMYETLDSFSFEATIVREVGNRHLADKLWSASAAQSNNKMMLLFECLVKCYTQMLKGPVVMMNA